MTLPTHLDTELWDTGWRSMKTAPKNRTVLLKCSDGTERIGKFSRGAFWKIECGGFVIDASKKNPKATGFIEATHWK